MKSLFFLTFIVLCGYTPVAAQGCSDAGFCTLGALKSGYNNKPKSSIALSLGINSGEEGTSIIIPQLELKKKLFKKGVAEIKLPYYFVSGDLGNNTGLGDVFLTYTHNILNISKVISLSGTAGARISTGNATAAADNGMDYPMPYQSNLGSTDLVLGASINWRKYITIALGYQQPIIQYNNNQYLPASYTNEPAAKEYFPSRELKRKGDVLFRLEGHYNIKSLSLSAGPLFIYHLGQDDITYITQLPLGGSEGLTLNLSGNIGYTFFNRLMIDISAGTPLVVRTVRPDGLTRAWVMVPRVSYMFK